MAGIALDKLHIMLALSNMQASEGLKDILLRNRVGSIHAAADNRDAVQHMQERAYNLIVIDENFPVLGGIDFCRFLRLTNTPMAVAPIIFGVHDPDQKKVLAARDAGATKIAVMPFSGASLIKAIEAASGDARAIVQCNSYNGPDRRTRKAPPPGGRERRQKTATLISVAQQQKILSNF